jgi:hypothetical protein
MYMDLKEICCEDVEWIHLTSDRVQWQVPVYTVMNLQVTQKARYFMIS